MSKPMNFEYSGARDGAGIAPSVSLYADRSILRSEIEEDCAEAGLRMLHSGEVSTLLEGGLALLGDVVLLDIPVTSVEQLAALCRIDMRVEASGAQLIVSTSIEALDDVFACVDQSSPQILVNPSRADRLVAIGRSLSNVSHGRVRELSHEDRFTLLHLSEQVDQIAKRLDGLRDIGLGSATDRSVFNYGPDKLSAPEPLVSASATSLPDPRYVREIIRRRQARARFFEAELFADPAWDMLLDLTAAAAEQRHVCVTSLCIASGVPTTTALRWIKQMTDVGIFVRFKDVSDKRRAFISLSDDARDAMASYFVAIGEPEPAYAV